MTVDSTSLPDSSSDQAEPFIKRWSASGAAERANCQPFLAELCDLIGVPRPEPAWTGIGSDSRPITQRSND